MNLDRRIGFDLLSQRGDRDREVQQLVLEPLDLWKMFGVAKCDLIEQPERLVGVGNLRTQRRVECIDGGGYPMQPRTLASWRGRSERVFEDVQCMQCHSTLAASVGRERIECRARIR